MIENIPEKMFVFDAVQGLEAFGRNTNNIKT